VNEGQGIVYARYARARGGSLRHGCGRPATTLGLITPGWRRANAPRRSNRFRASRPGGWWWPRSLWHGHRQTRCALRRPRSTCPRVGGLLPGNRAAPAATDSPVSAWMSALGAGDTCHSCAAFHRTTRRRAAQKQPGAQQARSAVSASPTAAGCRRPGAARPPRRNAGPALCNFATVAWNPRSGWTRPVPAQEALSAVVPHRASASRDRPMWWMCCSGASTARLRSLGPPAVECVRMARNSTRAQ